VKQILCVLLLAALVIMTLPALAAADTTYAWGPTTFGSVGVAYAVAGPANHQHFTCALGAVKFKQLPHGAVYLMYQYSATENRSWGGSGARAMLLDQWRKVPEITWGVGLGFIDDIQQKPDGGLIPGLEFDGTVSYDVSDWLDLSAFGLAADGGDDFHWMVAFALTVKAPDKLLPGF
jgi:hypothetical protein